MYANVDGDADPSRLPPAAAPTRESAIPKGGALIPINPDTVEFASGLVGGAVGLVLGGPIGAAMGTAAANYATR